MLTKSDIEVNPDRVHEWIKAADQKVSIFRAFQGVVLTILSPTLFSWATKHSNELSPLELFVFFVGIVLVGYSIYRSASALLSRSNRNNAKKSRTFFGDIATLSL